MRVTEVARGLARRSFGHLLVLAAVFAIMLAALAALPSATQAADGERLLVANLRGHALLIVDPARPDGARQITLPGGPHELLRLPDGRVAVSLEQSGIVALVDLDTGAVESLATGGLPHGLALQHTSEGDRLLVTDRDRDALRHFVIGGAPSTWREVESTRMSGWPHAVVARADGAVAVARASDAMLSLDGHDVPVSALPETVALSSDGAWIATAGAVGGEVHVFGWDGATQMDVQVGGRPVRTVFSPDGSLVAVALSASSGVALVDRAGGVRTVAVAGTPDGLAFSLDGTRLYAADMSGGRVTVVEVATRRVLAVMSVGRSAGSLMVLAPAR